MLWEWWETENYRKQTENSPYLMPPPKVHVFSAAPLLPPRTLGLQPFPKHCLKECRAADEDILAEMTMCAKKKIIKHMNRTSSPTPSLRSISAFVGLIIPSTFIVPILLISLSVKESCEFTKIISIVWATGCYIFLICEMLMTLTWYFNRPWPKITQMITCLFCHWAKFIMISRFNLHAAIYTLQ